MGKLILNGVEYIRSDPNAFPPMIYSTEEREVGVWTDGKPLYQKTIDVGVLIKDTSWHDVACGISNVDKFVDIFGIAFGEDENFYTLPNYRPGRSEGIITNCYFDSNSVPQFSYINNLLTNAYAWITIKYTKTTDTPGSGNWSTSGTPTQHYSETEHIIGTWIDGKPIYEKTFYVSSLTANDNWQNAGSIPNLKMLIDYECLTVNSSGWTGDATSFRGDKNVPQIAGSPSDECIYYAIISGTSVRQLYITARYTKTTD